MNFVLDASVALAWCFQDKGGHYVLEVLEALRESEAVVPSLWSLEVSNGLLVAERRGRLAPPGGQRFIETLLALPITVEPGSTRAAFGDTRRLARAHHLSAYDAAYLELSNRLGVPLATSNAALAAAAEGEGVGRFRPG